MKNSDQITLFQKKLIEFAASPSGFSASELTGYSPETVRRAAETLVKLGSIVRLKVSPRRIRYFADAALGEAYMRRRAIAPVLASTQVAGSRTKAQWRPEEPGRITPKTKIYIAPPLPRNVYRTYTYPQF